MNKGGVIIARYNFSVHYDGSGLQDNRISVSDLAPSLIALSNSFQEIQHLINPDEPTLSLDIVANEKGSFIVDLILANGQDLIYKAMDFLSSNDSNAVINLITYSDIFINVIKTIKRLANHKIKRKDKPKDGSVRLTLDDNTTLKIPENVLNAYQNISIRQEIKESVKPLEKDGIEQIDFYHSKKKKITVNKSDYPSFEVPPAKPKELDTVETTVFLQIVNVAFEHGKWKFSDGSNQFFADIEDEEFLESVKKNQQQFGSTDTLKVILRTKQFIDTEGNLKNEKTVVKVLEHKKGAQQLELDLEENSKDI